MRLNFYQFREQIKQSLLREKTRLDVNWDPFLAAWLAYALNQDGYENNPLLSELLESLQRWSQEPEAWEYQRHLGPLALLTWLRRKKTNTTSEEIIERIVQKLEGVDADDKFSPLRDPEQVFFITLGIAEMKHEKGRKKLLQIAKEQMRGPIRRRLLYSAAIEELGDKPLPIIPPEEETDEGNIIALVWWLERYPSELEKSKWWTKFDNIKDNIALSAEHMADYQRVISISELAMLYEALTRETKTPDPNLLFDTYPLHPRVRGVSESLFKKQEYFNAVFEATKVLNDFLRELTTLQTSETTLVSQSLGDPNTKPTNPRIKLNPLDPTSHDYGSQQNEQRGFSHLASGVFYAFRHPKGHEPKDKQWGDVGPYEALDQLVVISLVMKRIEEATSTP